MFPEFWFSAVSYSYSPNSNSVLTQMKKSVTFFSHNFFACEMNYNKLELHGNEENNEIYPVTQLLWFLLPPASSLLFSLPSSTPKSLCISKAQ